MAILISLGVLEDVVGRTDGPFGHLAEHLGQFESPGFTGKAGEAGESAAVLNDLLYLVMLVTEGSQLRQVRDHHHLVGAAQAP